MAALGVWSAWFEPRSLVVRREELTMLEESELLGLTETGEIEGFGFGNGGDGADAFGDLADLPADGDGDKS